MQSSANFKVDPRLASLLGENYRSTELAIKELVDNSFDADAEHVWVTLPKPLTNDPIVIKDDGVGMTERELRNEYLNIASSRVSRKGEYTPMRRRKVKGRKGIGKFAGLMVASLMEVKTQTRGKSTHLKIWRDELIKGKNDLEQINLPVDTDICPTEEVGTQIILSGINQNFTFPNPDRLKHLLALEYGRQKDFSIYVDGTQVDIEDIPGETFEHNFPLSTGENVNVRYTIADVRKSLRHSGMAIRVGGKIVGNPGYFGLDEHDDIPFKLLKRLFGEIATDALQDDVTADWGSIIINSKVLQEITEKIQPLLAESLLTTYEKELYVSKARLKKTLLNATEGMSPIRKKYVENTIDRILKKFYGESEARIANVLSVLLESLEKNDYWMVMQSMEDHQDDQVEEMVDAFSEFGLIDIAMIAQQSTHRLQILRNLESLIFNPETKVYQIRKALENNLWLLGNQFALITTNSELQESVNLYLDHKFTNGHAKDRPELLPIQEFNKNLLMLDLKAPESTLDMNDWRQAKQYIQDLSVYLPGRTIKVLSIGGAVEPNLVSQRVNSDIRFLSFKALLSEARVQLNWLISELQKKN
ncbi:MAG: ATP-binding protein [Bacteroidota bacterium]